LTPVLFRHHSEATFTQQQHNVGRIWAGSAGRIWTDIMLLSWAEYSCQSCI